MAQWSSFGLWTGCVVLLGALTTTPVMAQEGRASTRGEQQTLNSQSFMAAHPDIKHRLDGLLAYEEGQYEEALDEFRRSAHYADKLSQAMLAEMHWQGKGVAEDRAAAYVWADIAAERGYEKLVLVRENYWSNMEDAERTRALELGPALYSEYGDAAAKPRMDRHLRRARFSMISKRPRRDIDVVVQDHSGQSMVIRGHHFYDPKYWDPKLYHAWADETWSAPPRGRVDIGDLESLKPDQDP